MAKKKDHTPFYQNKDFMSTTAQKTLDLIKDNVDKMIHQHFQRLNQALQETTSNMARSQMESAAKVYTRIMAIEKTMMDKDPTITRESLRRKIVEVEDEATGHILVDRPATQGDYLRTTISTKRVDSETFSAPTQINIASLQNEPAQTYPEVEAALVGMKAGDTKIIDVAVKQGETTTNYNFQITLEFVSEPTEEKKAELARRKQALENINNPQGAVDANQNG